MAYTIEVDDELIENTLADPEWPWIIALAYSVKNAAPDAVATMIWALNHYASGKCSEVTTDIALTHLYGLVAGETPEFDWSIIDNIERPIIRAIRAGVVTSFGRSELGLPLAPLTSTFWAGGEIVASRTSDLKMGGGRRSSDFDSTFAGQQQTWAYDIHVSACDLRALLEMKVSNQSDSLKAILPTHAKSAHRRDEIYAHAAAKLMRDGIERAEAIRQVRPVDNTRENASIERAVRNALDLMYDKSGKPLK